MPPFFISRMHTSPGIVRGPGQHNADLGIKRTFSPPRARSTKESRVVFRAELSNLTNTPQLAKPRIVPFAARCTF